MDGLQVFPGVGAVLTVHLGTMLRNSEFHVKGRSAYDFDVLLIICRMQIAHSIPWFTVSSLLSYYSVLYGPQILLMMNIAYYLPSIPLLIFSAACDDWLDLKFGEALLQVISFNSLSRNTTLQNTGMALVHSNIEDCQAACAYTQVSPE